MLHSGKSLFTYLEHISTGWGGRDGDVRNKGSVKYAKCLLCM